MRSLQLRLPDPVQGRLAVLDELKGLAIVLVILYHAGGVLVWNNYLHGDIGVDVFVILSGLGLGLSTSYRGALPFLRRRLVRILPTYWIVLTAFLLLNSHFLQKEYSAFDVTTHYLGVHGFFGDLYALSINDSFWYITLLVVTYVLYCLMRPLLARPDRFLLVAALISVAVALAFFFTGQSGSFSHLGLRLPGFFAGILLGRLLATGAADIPLTPALAGAAFVGMWVPYTQGVVFHTFVAGLAIMTAYACGWKLLAPASVAAPVGSVLAFLGRHSLEIFLIHQPLIRDYNVYLHGRWFNQPTPSAASLVVGMAVGLAVTLIVAVELHRLIARIVTPRAEATAA